MSSATGGTGRISVLICDDERLLTDALALVFRSSANIYLTHPPVSKAEEAIALAEQGHPDVVLMDVRLASAVDGIEATRRIRSVSPSTKVVVLTADPSECRVVSALEAGAVGVLSKEEAVEDVVEAVVRAAEGAMLFDPQRLPALLVATAEQRRREAEIHRLLDMLTHRERQILDAMCHGERPEDVAARLFISRRTVATHIQSILRKLKVHSQLAAVALVSEARRLAS